MPRPSSVQHSAGPDPIGPVALVTGASSGIGRATAQALHAAGFTTYASARRLETLTDLAAQGLHTVALDVTDEQTMQAALQTIGQRSGPVMVLVNNAGYGLNGPTEELDLKAVRQQFETNVFGLLRLSQLVLPGMRRAGWGRIIHVGSIGGTFTVPGAGAYHASKYAVEALSDAMRGEVRAFGVDVVLIQPTGVLTPFLGKTGATLPDTGVDSPYAFFKHNMARVTAQMNTGGSRYGLIRAEEVAQVIVRAAQLRRPNARYKVGLSAHLYAGARRLLPDRLWDRLMAAQFPVMNKAGAGDEIRTQDR